MIVKILNYFNIGMPNLTYKSSGQAQEFSQRTLTNMGYFWNLHRRAYYFWMGKNGKKIINFDDPVEFSDDAHGSAFGAGFGGASSIMAMLQSM